MNDILDVNHIRARRISPDGGGQYFFGYYDNRASHPGGKLHLCYRVPSMDRLPTGEGECELESLDMDTGVSNPVALTRSWNFQQSAMLQWNPVDPDEIIYNVYTDHGYRAVVKNIRSEKGRMLQRPLADVSADGEWGLSIDIDRVYDFRTGYGHYNGMDAWKDQNAPEGNRILLVDMENGQAKQIITYAQLDWIHNWENGHHVDRETVINHITFSQESNRFLFLVRFLPESSGIWRTRLGTSDLGGDIYKLRPYTFASHYYWGKQGKLMLYGGCVEGNGLYVMQDETRDYAVYDRTLFHEDIHCSYPPDGQWLIGDGYQDEDQYRPVYLYHINSKRGMAVDRFYSPHLSSMDTRCNLHCRWDPNGTDVSFGSIHKGKRRVYMMDLIEAMSVIKNK